MLAIGFLLAHTVVLGFAGLALKQMKGTGALDVYTSLLGLTNNYLDYLLFVNEKDVLLCALERTPFSFLGAFVPAVSLPT